MAASATASLDKKLQSLPLAVLQQVVRIGATRAIRPAYAQTPTQEAERHQDPSHRTPKSAPPVLH